MRRVPSVTPAVAAALGAILLSAFAAADPELPSYEQGRQSVDDAAGHGPLRVTDLAAYCDILMRWELKSGLIAVVESPADFLAGCEDEGRIILAAQ